MFALIFKNLFMTDGCPFSLPLASPDCLPAGVTNLGNVVSQFRKARVWIEAMHNLLRERFVCVDMFYSGQADWPLVVVLCPSLIADRIPIEGREHPC